ncbi:MAG TPA: SDR family oxidoreductase [Mycobacteriales bacterium]|nr:SDR family oxidoreductase [Mycobacteriales bacterium]
MSAPETFRFAGGTAVVTGAASGMGEHLARGLAARGCGLALVDRDGARLRDVAASITAAHPHLPVAIHVADLADPAAVDRLGEEVLATHPRISLLVNNAGVSMSGSFTQLSADEFDWVMQVNFRAPVALIRALLPRLLESPGSHVVNTSSLWGLAAPANNAAYATSKFALRGLSEALRQDLARKRIGVTTVFPGGVATRIVQEERPPASVSEEQAERRRRVNQQLLTYPPDRAAERILRGIERREARVVFTTSAITVDVASRLFPTHYTRVLAAVTATRMRLAGARLPRTRRSVPGTSG